MKSPNILSDGVISPLTLMLNASMIKYRVPALFMCSGGLRVGSPDRLPALARLAIPDFHSCQDLEVHGGLIEELTRFNMLLFNYIIIQVLHKLHDYMIRQPNTY